jgi:hypothetical protein
MEGRDEKDTSGDGGVNSIFGNLPRGVIADLLEETLTEWRRE